MAPAAQDAVVNREFAELPIETREAMLQGIKKETSGQKAEGVNTAKQALLAAIDDFTEEQCKKLLPIVLSAKTVL